MWEHVLDLFHHAINILSQKVAITYEYDVVDRAKRMEWNERVITICCFLCFKKRSRHPDAVNHRKIVCCKLNRIRETIYNAKTWQNSCNLVYMSCHMLLHWIETIKSIYLCITQYECTRLFVCSFAIIHVLSNRCKCLRILFNQLSLLKIYFLQLDSIIHAWTLNLRFRTLIVWNSRLVRKPLIIFNRINLI